MSLRNAINAKCRDCIYDPKSGMGTESSELIWSSIAETILANEGVSQDPVFLEEATRVTLGGIMADFLNRRTSSRYTPLDETLNQLIGSSAPAEQKNGNSGEGAKKE